MKKFFLSILVFLFLSSPAWGAIYYVDQTGGLDTNDGLTPEAAWKTIAKVNTTLTGDQSDTFVRLKAGEIWREQNTIAGYGTAGHPYTWGTHGTGEKPIITGADIVTGSWTQAATTVEGSVSRANLWLSLDPLYPHVDFSSDNKLTPYQGYELDIVDSAGKHLKGIIGAAGTGRTYSSNLLTNGGFETGNPPANWTPLYMTLSQEADPRPESSGSYSMMETGQGGSGWAVQQMTHVSGALLYYNVWAKTDGTAAWLLIYGTTQTSSNYDGDGGSSSSWTEKGFKRTAIQENLYFWMYSNGGAGGTGWIKFDDASATQVLTPSSTGVTMTWTSEDSGFNRIDSNYTYTISTNIITYYVPSASNPGPVFEDGVLLQASPSLSTIPLGGWYWGSGNLYVRTFDDSTPSDNVIEAGVRTSAITISDKSYITLSGLDLRGGTIYGLNAQGQISGLSLVGNTFQYNFADNALVKNITTELSNILVSGNEFLYGGANGLNFIVYYPGTGIQVINNIADHNAQVQLITGYYQWTAGIKLTCELDSSNSILVSGNIVTNGASPYTSGTNVNGVGIWSDCCNYTNITKNYTANNFGAGYMLEKNVNSILVYNISYNDSKYGFAHEAAYSDTYGNGSIYLRVGETNNGSGNLIANNTVVGGWQGITNRSYDTSTTSNNIFRNNIVVGQGSYALYAGPGGDNDITHGSGNIYDHNAFGPARAKLAYWNVAKATYADLDTAYGSAMNNVQSDPLFVDPPTDFHLQPTSPCKYAGTKVGLTQDYEGNPVPTDYGPLSITTGGGSLSISW